MLNEFFNIEKWTLVPIINVILSFGLFSYFALLQTLKTATKYLYLSILAFMLKKEIYTENI